jgi:adenylate cyclase
VTVPRETPVTPSADWRPRALQAFALGLVTASLAILLWGAGALDTWEARAWDLRVRHLSAPGAATPKLRLIFLDQYSLDWGKEQGWSWPWPRQVYAAILDFCRRGGAKAVAFDVIYSEPSGFGVEDDAAFGKAIAATPGFVGAVFVGRETGGATRWPADVPAPGIAWRAELPAGDRRLQLPSAMFPIPEVATNATLLATVFGNPDPHDGIYRRLQPFSVFDGQVVPSLALAAYLATATNRTLTPGPRTLGIGGLPAPVPLDKSGAAILRFRGPSQTHKTYTAASVIASEQALVQGETPVIPPEDFKDAYVFFGFTAPGLFDLKSSAVAAVYPGVEIQATFLDNLLSGDFIRPASQGPVACLTLLLAVLAALTVRMARHAWQSLSAFALLLPVPVIVGGAAYPYGLWIPVVVQLVAVVPALIGALAINYATEGRQKRFIKGAFKQYLSPVVIEELVAHPERLKLGGESRELSIFFSDLKGFTGISEPLTPEALTALLNDYLTAMTDIIYRHGGTVDKYEGDAIIAFWNAPLAQPDHAVLAVRAALECQATLADLRPRFRERIGADLHQRIGLNSGPVVVGNMGSRQRFNYTFLGDAGNLASRLEGINKPFGTSILISERTRAKLGEDSAVREISRVRVVGRKDPVRVFEPLAPADAAARREALDRFARALERYYTGAFAEALALFESLAAGDPPAAAYVNRCRELMNRPPADWDGVWTLTEK